MSFNQIFLTNNLCYKAAAKMTPKRIIIHSTGVNNPNLSRYVQPNKYDIGVNKYGNDWNRAQPKGQRVCVHGFVGKDANGVVKFIQTLPFEIQCWGCGSGKNGSYNRDAIQIEICEAAKSDKSYLDKCIEVLKLVIKELARIYNIPSSEVISHKEAAARGYASSHVDPEHWINLHGYDMDVFRNAVKEKTINVFKPYIVRVTASVLNIRKEPTTNAPVVGTITKGEAYTIISEHAGKGATKWGKLKSGIGYISLDYTEVIR